MVDHVPGASRRGVLEQAVQRAVVLRRSGAEIVGAVQHQLQAAGRERGPQRGGMLACGIAAVAKDAAGRSVHLHPTEACRLEALEHRRGGPPLGGHVDAQAGGDPLPAGVVGGRG